MPTAQSTQAEEEAELYLPAPQLAHAVAPEAEEKVPAAQAEHCESGAPLNFPGTQLTHPELAPPPWPAAHEKQAVAPTSDAFP